MDLEAASAPSGLVHIATGFQQGPNGRGSSDLVVRVPRCRPTNDRSGHSIPNSLAPMRSRRDAAVRVRRAAVGAERQSLSVVLLSKGSTRAGRLPGLSRLEKNERSCLYLRESSAWRIAFGSPAVLGDEWELGWGRSRSLSRGWSRGRSWVGEVGVGLKLLGSRASTALEERGESGVRALSGGSVAQ
jgi:hypothetical protein